VRLRGDVTESTADSFIAAIVPAAGRSERMGRPKLILPIGGVPLIIRVVTSLRQGGASLVVVVSPPESAPGASELIRLGEAVGARVLIPDDQPPDMRASVELGLAELVKRAEKPNAVLLTPGDSPALMPSLVQSIIQRAHGLGGSIVVPTFDGQRGHPLWIPWDLALEIPSLPPEVGVNALLACFASRVVYLPVEDRGSVSDLDSPEDLRLWQAANES
jgi:molybdenum cofactor cytidylyltransferase